MQGDRVIDRTGGPALGELTRPPPGTTTAAVGGGNLADPQFIEGAGPP